MRLHMFIQGRCSEAKTFYSSMLTMCWVNVDSVCRNAKTSAAAGKRHQRWVSKQPTELVSRNWTKWSAVISCKDSLGRCRYCFEHRLLLHPARHDRSHVLREEKLQSLPKVWWLYIKKLGLATWRDGEGSAIHLHPNSYNMEDVIITVAHSKWEFFGRAGRSALAVH